MLAIAQLLADYTSGALLDAVWDTDARLFKLRQNAEAQAGADARKRA